MFDPTSRYYGVGVVTLIVSNRDGPPIEVRYLKRRFIPATDSETTLLEHNFNQGERLDNITANYMDDPTQFWRVCDTNGAMLPEELEQIGQVIRIALPNV